MTPSIYALALGSFLVMPVIAQDKQSEFCSSRTTEAYHSPKCSWGFVVHDPHRVENVTIRHKPAYHTYSRWALDGSTYLFAYRDIGDQPAEMAVDIYLAEGGAGFKRVGSARIPGLVVDVSTERLTGRAVPNVLFRLQGGELTYLEVVRIFDGKAKEVFCYGASLIDVSINPNPTIVAKSKLANTVEQFAWDPKSAKFVKTAEHPWNKVQ